MTVAAPDADVEQFKLRAIGTRSKLAIVEFDDHGEMRNPNQLAAATQYLIARDDRPLLVVVFAHGWHHDASPNDSNLRDFQKMLLQLEKQQWFSGEIVGIYLGWRGNVLRFGSSKSAIVDNLETLFVRLWSFGSRKAAAERVGRVSCTEAILSLLTAAKLKEGDDGHFAKRDSTVKSIVAGHSFGGIVIERSFVQAMLGYGIINAPSEAELDRAGRIGNAAIEPLNQAHKASLDRKTIATQQLAVCQENLSSKEAKKKEVEFALKERGRLAEIDARVRSNILSDPELPNWHFSASKKLEHQSDNLERQRSKWPAAEAAELDSFLREIRDLQTRITACKTLSLKEISEETTSMQEPLNALKQLQHSVTLREQVSESPQGGTSRSFAERVKSLADRLWGSKNDEVRDTSGFDSDTHLPTIITDLGGILEACSKRYNNSLAAELAAYRTAFAASDHPDLDRKKDDLEEEIKDLKENVGGLRATIRETTTNLSQIEGDKLQAGRMSEAIRKSRETPPADLILLINPASEAIVAQQMQDFWSNRQTATWLRRLWNTPGRIRPWLVSVSSEGDKATKTIFPLGMSLFVSPGALRPAQKERFRRTAPHINTMVTHRIVNADEVGVYREAGRKPRPFRGAGKGLFLVESLDKDPEEITPYWVVRATKAQLPDHSRFFTEQFYLLTAELIRVAEGGTSTD